MLANKFLIKILLPFLSLTIETSVNARSSFPTIILGYKILQSFNQRSVWSMGHLQICSCFMLPGYQNITLEKQA